ncbi:uncharacterized protein LOC111400195 [Olea europaea var. sylvestris]|uniref:uncharacterized protein LOC111400195 n=1 Tax=Olea europaea var. sylvestris TaxID=158386 RepID=UPI000C1CCFA7|nr:uncharacterized protein LOC111400195 [Olea europaea var. sylvestris]
MPHSIISDNGKQFDKKKVRSLCEELDIKKHLSTPHHRQANNQVEAVKKTIKHVLKRKFDVSKGAWVDELPQVLWVVRTTIRTPIRETTFLMAYGTETKSSVEVGLPSPRHLHFSEITNDEHQRCDLDFIKERRDDSQKKLATYQRKMTKYYNSKVKKMSFQINDQVLRRVFLSSKEPGTVCSTPPRTSEERSGLTEVREHAKKRWIHWRKRLQYHPLATSLELRRACHLPPFGKAERKGEKPQHG